MGNCRVKILGIKFLCLNFSYLWVDYMYDYLTCIPFLYTCVKGEHRGAAKGLATFEATVFIALHGKQPLEKNWHAKGSPTTHEIIMP